MLLELKLVLLLGMIGLLHLLSIILLLLYLLLSSGLLMMSVIDLLIVCVHHGFSLLFVNRTQKGARIVTKCIVECKHALADILSIFSNTL
jgi:hypothetical protein